MARAFRRGGGLLVPAVAIASLVSAGAAWAQEPPQAPASGIDAPAPDLDEVLGEIEAQLRGLGERRAARSQEVETLRAELDATRQRMAEMELSLTSARRERDQLEQELTDLRLNLEHELESARKTEAEAGRQLASVSAERDAALSEAQELREQLRAAVGRLRALSATLASLKPQVEPAAAPRDADSRAVAQPEPGQSSGVAAALAELGAVEIRSGTLITVPGEQLFGFNSAEIWPAAEEVLPKVAEVIAAMGDRPVLIVGHTDSTGDPAYNQDLSRRRAEAVKAYLVERLKVDAERLETVGAGDGRPIASNDTPEGRRSNRRIEIVIVRPAPSERIGRAGDPAQLGDG